MIEIVLTVLIVSLAVYIFVKSIRKKSKSGCDCGSCSAQCPNYKEARK
jgi:hypothetical protein